MGISPTSDSTKKENFLKVNGENVLEKFRYFKLTSWNFKDDDPKTQRHYGIMAQDFFSAFGHNAIGIIGNDTTVSVMDMNGINMIAMQALEKRTTEHDQRIKIQEKRIEELEKQNADLKNELESVKLMVNKLAGKQKEVNVTYK